MIVIVTRHDQIEAVDQTTATQDAAITLWVLVPWQRELACDIVSAPTDYCRGILFGQNKLSRPDANAEMLLTVTKAVIFHDSLAHLQ